MNECYYGNLLFLLLYCYILLIEVFFGMFIFCLYQSSVNVRSGMPLSILVAVDESSWFALLVYIMVIESVVLVAESG